MPVRSNVVMFRPPPPPPPTEAEDTNFSEMSRPAWLAWMRRTWKQGQHIAIMGRTGRGKTTLVRDVAAVREWVAVAAIKRKDETLTLFPKVGYKVIAKWPPAYGLQRVVLWAKPKSLYDMTEQQKQMRLMLGDVYKNGGWTLVFDDVARVANALGFKREIAMMLNEARSQFSSIICNMTQPSSVTQAIPSETWRQVRFHLVFFYRVGRDLEAIADIVGYSKTELKKMMSLLKPFDFLCFDDLTDSVILVRS